MYWYTICLESFYANFKMIGAFETEVLTSLRYIEFNTSCICEAHCVWELLQFCLVWLILDGCLH